MSTTDHYHKVHWRGCLPAAMLVAVLLLTRGVRAAAPVWAKALPEDVVVSALKQGRYQQALTELAPRLNSPQENLALRLYERGVAQFQLGVAANDPAMLRDAGLSFMRVVIYFGRPGGVSPFYGPALVAAAQVFERLGRPELALTLYRQSRDVLTRDDDAPLAALRDQHLKSLEPPETPEPASPPTAAPER
jgi:hypothetical protein